MKRVDIDCEPANKMIEQVYKVSTPCRDDHQFTKDEPETIGELAEVCSQIVFVMLLFGAHRQTRYCMVSELFGKSYHEAQQSLRQKIGRVDFLHSSHESILTILPRGRHSITMLTWIVADFAGHLADSKSTSKGVLFSQKPHDCSSRGSCE